MNLLIFGDSIVQGCWDEEGGWPSRIQQEINQRQIKDAEPFVDYNMTYIRGVSGDTSEDLKDRIGFEIGTMSLSSHATALISIGINDSIMEETGNRVPREKFRKNISAIIDHCSELDQVFFVGLTPVDESRSDPLPDEPGCSFLNSEIKDYNQILKQVAEDESASFIPVFERLNSQSWEQKLWDGVHPNTEGHRRIFELIWSELDQYLKYSGI